MMQKHILLLLLLLAAVVFSFFLYGESSLVNAVSVPTPTLRSPANQSNPVITEAGVITLDWNAVEVSGAGPVERYQIEVTRETIEKEDGVYQKKTPIDEFSLTVLYPTTELSLSAANLGKAFLHGEIYRWRVQACFTNCVFASDGSEWTAWRTFIPKFEKPNLIKPINNGLVLFSPQDPILLQWEEAPFAARHKLLIDGDDITALTPMFSTAESTLGFSIFSGLVQEALNWTVTPLISLQGSLEYDAFFTALRALFPGDNIPADSVSSEESFFVRFMPPKNPITPKSEIGITGDVPSQITLQWQDILNGASNTKYQVKKPDGTEEFVGSSTNTLLVQDEFTVCELNTWEVRSCNGAGSNCGPYPSYPGIPGAYPIGHGIQEGPWEFMFVPEFEILGENFNVSRVWDGVKGKVNITAIIGGTAGGEVSINFGDGASDQIGLVGNELSTEHIYARSGTYTITIGRGCGTPFTSIEDIDIEFPRVRSFDVDPKFPAWANAESPSVEITWNVTDTGGSGLDNIKVWIGSDTTGDGEPDDWSEIDGDPVDSTFTHSPGDGTWWYGIHSSDNAGNCITEGGKICGPGDLSPNDGVSRKVFSSIKVQVDTDTPSPPSHLDLTEGSRTGSVDDITSDSTPILRGGGEAESTIRISRTTTTVPPSTTIVGVVEAWTGTGGWNIKLGRQYDGKYIYTATAEDDAGNKSDPSEGLTITIDTTKPTCEFSTKVSSGGYVTLKTIDEPNVEYFWGIGSGRLMSTDINQNLINVTYDAGEHLIELEVEDQAGNRSGICTASVTVSPPPGEPTPTPLPPVNDPPTIDEKIILIPSSGVVAGSLIYFRVDQWTDSDGDSVKSYVCNSNSPPQSPQSDKSCSAGKTWCYVDFTRGSYLMCSYPTKPTDQGEQDYFIFVCDQEECSAPREGTFSVSEAPGPGWAGSPDFPDPAAPSAPPATSTSGVPSATTGICENYCKALSGDEDFDIATEQDALGGTTCLCNPLGTLSFSDIIDRILRFLFNIAIVLAPIMGVIAGIMFVTATGDPGQIEKAKRILFWTAVGFVVILVSRGLVAVISGIIGL